MRAHGHIDMTHREPFLQSARVQKAIKGAITLRYDLNHYIYTAFYFASTQGTPIMRPTWYEFPENLETYHLDE